MAGHAEEFFYASISDLYDLDEWLDTLYPGTVCTSPIFEVSENRMQAAGRRSDQPFKDFRSARYAHQRTRKYPRKKRTRKQDRVYGLWGYNKNGQRLRVAEETHHFLQQESWWDDFGAELAWNEEMEWTDELSYFSTFGKWRYGKTIGDGGDGEDFEMWGQRRIEEMRRVKEDRLRKQQQNSGALKTQPAPLPSITTSSSKAFVPTTTLPTTAMDIHGHKILREILIPNKYQIQWLRRQGKPPFNTINGFYWFGQYSWAWHRNEWGFWEFGGPECDYPLFCACCGCGGWRCACDKFKGKPAPDEVHSCALVEWTKGPLRDMLEEEHFREAEEDRELDVVSDVQEEPWEMMSDAASEGWSVVSEEEEFEVV